MICSEDPEIKCGSAWRNSVYMLTHYEGEDDDCGGKPPKDCSKAGGLDESDKCKQTCKNDKI